MNRTLFMAAIALVTLASCNEDDSLTQYGNGSRTIAFSTHQKATRAGQTITSLDQFTVTAVHADNTSYFNDVEFVYDQSAGIFKSEVPRYWPADGTLSFYAINHTGTLATPEGNIPTYTYDNWAGEKDLVAATVKSGVKTVPYPLTFKHITSQIYVSAEAQDKTGDLTYKLLSVKMTAPSTGTYRFADATEGTGTWEVDNSVTSEYSYEDGLPRTFRQNGQVELSSTYWNILPVTDGDINFVIEYQILQSDKVIADFTGANSRKCPVEAPGLIPGKQYVYNFVLPLSIAEEIGFTANVSDWEDRGLNNLEPKILVESFELSRTSIYVSSNDVPSSHQLYAQNFFPAEASRTVIWSTDNPDVVTVDSGTGMITIIAPGSANVTATATDGSGVKRTCHIECYLEPEYE